MNQMTITVEGMSCPSCAKRVAKALQEVPGVAVAEVSLDARTATVCTTATVEPALLVAAVEKKGYTARVGS